MKHFNIPIFINHIGCPNMCVFCNQNKINGADSESSIYNIEKIIDEQLETIPAGSSVEISYFGGSFTGIAVELQEKLLKKANEYIKAGKVTGIRVSTRPDYINSSVVEMLLKYGATTVELGVQSFDTEVLNKSKRGHSYEEIIDATKIIKKAGINLGIQLMPGLPGSDFEKDYRSAVETVAIKPEYVRIYPTVVVANTELEELYKKGEYNPLTLDEAVEISSKMIAVIELAGIKIIRVGLQPSEELRAEGNIVAGPFHPAFRELAEGEINYRFLKKLNETLGNLEIRLNEKDVSKTVGIKKKNIERIGVKNIVIKIDNSIEKGNMAVNGKIYSREDILKNMIG